MAKANFSIKDFRSTIFNDSLARTNRFEVFISYKPRGISATKPWNISLYCEQASLPPINIASKSFKIFGATYQRPFTAEYGGEGMSMTFHVDRDMKVKTFFDEWMAQIVDPDSSMVGFQEDYISTINIKQLDEQENVTYEIELLEAFPRNMNLMELNNASTNQTHRLNVLFAYRYWRNIARPRQVNAVDVPRVRQYPEIPITDTRINSRAVTATGEDHYDQLGNFIGRW